MAEGGLGTFGQVELLPPERLVLGLAPGQALLENLMRQEPEAGERGASAQGGKFTLGVPAGGNGHSTQGRGARACVIAGGRRAAPCLELRLTLHGELAHLRFLVGPAWGRAVRKEWMSTEAVRLAERDSDGDLRRSGIPREQRFTNRKRARLGGRHCRVGATSFRGPSRTFDALSFRAARSSRWAVSSSTWAKTRRLCVPLRVLGRKTREQLWARNRFWLPRTFAWSSMAHTDTVRALFCACGTCGLP